MTRQEDRRSFSDGSGTTYRSLAPTAALRPFVEGIWVQEARRGSARGAPRATVVLPNGFPELVLYYGDPFVRLHDDASENEPTLAFGGQRTRPVRVAATGRTGIVIVRFHPWGAALLCREPMMSFLDRFVPFDVVVGREGAILQQRLLEQARDWRERVGLLLRFLEQRLPAARNPDPLTHAAVLAIRRDGGVEPIHRVSARLGVSRRHLARVFATSVGMSPKSFAALTRFQRTLRYRGSETDWAEVAVATGYHDQAHLIRAWRQFAGGPPRRLVQRHASTPLGAFFNNPATSHSYNTTYF